VLAVAWPLALGAAGLGQMWLADHTVQLLAVATVFGLLGLAGCAWRCQNRRVIFAVVFVVVIGCVGFGLLACWGRDMVAAGRNPITPAAPATTVAVVQDAGPGLCPQTVTASGEHFGAD
jgi:hypothetical protein